MIRRIASWGLLLALVLTVLFIFSNSLKTGEQSFEQSDAVGDWMEENLDIEKDPVYTVYHNRGSFAHLFEFALLGLEMAALLLVARARRPFSYLLGLALCVAVAGIDELLQLTSEGRTADLFDFGVDVLGVLLGFILLALPCMVAMYLLKKRRAEKEKTPTITPVTH